MVSWKLSLLVLVAVFVILCADVEGGRRNNRRNRGGGGDDDENTGSGVVSRRRNRNGGRRRNNGGTGGGGDGDSVGTEATDDGTPDAGGRRGRGGRRGGRGRRPGAGRGGRGRGGRGGRGRGGRRRGGSGGGRGRGRGRGNDNDDRLRNHFVHNNGKFGFNVYRHMANLSDNFAYSPLGVYTCTTIAMMGTNGPTKAQIIQGLNIRARVHPPSKSYRESLTFGDTEHARMVTMTGFYARPQINPIRRYRTKLRDFYNISVSNFHADDPVGNINEMVSSMTINEIPEFLADGDVLDSDLIMLINAFFFKGQWHQKFETADTQLQTFTGPNAQQFDVETMSQFGNYRHKHSSALEASILEVPYNGDRFALYIILPNQDTSLTDVESRLSYELINDTLGSLDAPSAFALKLPKFTIDTLQSMRTILQGFGITRIFQSNANLRKLTRHNNAFLSDIKHRAVFQVEENGGTPSPISDADSEFNVNRPFMFIVRDKREGINLLIGRYVNPQGDNVDD